MTCNELGWQDYAVAERELWTVEVYHSTVTTVNSAVATKITNIRVTIGADYVFTFPKEGWVPEVSVLAVVVAVGAPLCDSRRLSPSTHL